MLTVKGRVSYFPSCNDDKQEYIDLEDESRRDFHFRGFSSQAKALRWLGVGTEFLSLQLTNSNRTFIYSMPENYEQLHERLLTLIVAYGIDAVDDILWIHFEQSWMLDEATRDSSFESALNQAEAYLSKNKRSSQELVEKYPPQVAAAEEILQEQETLKSARVIANEIVAMIPEATRGNYATDPILAALQFAKRML